MKICVISNLKISLLNIEYKNQSYHKKRMKLLSDLYQIYENLNDLLSSELPRTNSSIDTISRNITNNFRLEFPLYCPDYNMYKAGRIIL